MVNNGERKTEKLEDVCEVYLFYGNDIRGHVPLLIYPDENIKKDVEKMYFIKTHYIWLLGIEEQIAWGHIDQLYKNKIYFAKSLPLNSRIKTIHLSRNEDFYTPRIIIIIIALPIDLIFFGGDLLNKISINIMLRYEFSIYQVIESELAKREKIKTPKIEEKIRKGNIIKNEIKVLIKNTIKQFFSNIVYHSNLNFIKRYQVV